MNYTYRFSGEPGNLVAVLYDGDGEFVTDTTALKDEKAVQKWAKGQAALDKQKNAIDRAHESTTHVQGAGAFAL